MRGGGGTGVCGTGKTTDSADEVLLTLVTSYSTFFHIVHIMETQHVLSTFSPSASIHMPILAQALQEKSYFVFS